MNEHVITVARCIEANEICRTSPASGKVASLEICHTMFIMQKKGC